MMSQSETGVNEWRRESLGGSGAISVGWLEELREFSLWLILSIFDLKNLRILVPRQRESNVLVVGTMMTCGAICL